MESLSYQKKSSCNGFTLVELLVVISIIALLLSILMPALNKVRNQGRMIVCLSVERQIGLGLLAYAADNKDSVVQGRYASYDETMINTWFSNLTPYLDTSKKANNKIYRMKRDDAYKYNMIWNKMICPSETVTKSVNWYQGIKMRTYGMNMGALHHTSSFVRYEDGFGLMDLNVGLCRKLSSVKQPSQVMAFCDMRACDYIYSGMYEALSAPGSGFDVKDFMPVRHPLGYNIVYCDGHAANVKKEVIQKGQGTKIFDCF